MYLTWLKACLQVSYGVNNCKLAIFVDICIYHCLGIYLSFSVSYGVEVSLVSAHTHQTYSSRNVNYRKH